eukprot:3939508-Rhodomonas_salina.1
MEQGPGRVPGVARAGGRSGGPGAHRSAHPRPPSRLPHPPRPSAAQTRSSTLRNPSLPTR